MLTIHYFPLDKKTLMRSHCTLDFRMNSPEHAQSWAETINGALGVTGDERRHVLVLINPFSGTKQAPQLWRTAIKPIFDLAGLTSEAVVTEYQGHARQLASQLDLGRYDAVCSVSGDGLFWELLNGLLARPDWAEAVKLPLAPLPGGSGNALAFAAGMGDPTTAAFCVARGRARPFDVASVLQERVRCTAFLQLSWGLVADVDFESERFRWMGGSRFAVSAVQRIAGLRLYRGRLSYYPVAGWSADAASAARCRPTHCPQCADESYPGRPTGLLTGADAWEAGVVPAGGGGNAFAGLEKSALPAGPPTPLLDSLAEGQEEGWVVGADDAYVMVCAANATHISSDSKMAPLAHWSDGCWDLVVIKELPKMALAKMFLALESGEHLDSPHVSYIKVRAFRIDPDPLPPGTESFLDVDGEKLPEYGPTGVEVHRGLVRLITL